MASLAGGGTPEPLPSDSRGVIEPPPKEFVCPITQELMIDPVFAEDGFSYERVAMTRWFSTGKLRSPVTNDLMEGQHLTPNQVLRSMISNYKSDIGARLLAAVRERTLTPAALSAYIDSGADVNVRDTAGNTPLLLLLRNFLPSAAPADAPAPTPSYMAGCMYLALELVKQGARVSGTNDDGVGALDVCKAAVGELRAELAEAEAQGGRTLSGSVEDEAKKKEKYITSLEKMADKIESLLEDELRRDKELEEARRRERAAVRQQQEDLQNAQANVANAANQENLNNAMAQNGMGQGLGFFPSLFGLQFQTVVPSPVTHPPTGMWARERASVKAMDVALKVFCAFAVVVLIVAGG